MNKNFEVYFDNSSIITRRKTKWIVIIKKDEKVII